MAQVLADDLDRTVDSAENPVRTYRFAWGLADADVHTTYEVDLTAQNFEKLTDALSDYVQVARSVDGSSASALTRSVASLAERLAALDENDDQGRLSLLKSFVDENANISVPEAKNVVAGERKPNARRSTEAIEAEKAFKAARDSQRGLIAKWAKTEDLSVSTKGSPLGQAGLDKFYAAHPEEVVLYGKSRHKELPSSTKG